VILVTVGTNEARFDRLLRAVEDLGGNEALFVQHGPSPVRPPDAECVDFVPFDVLVEKMKEARAVITHAGVGSIMVALSLGRRPVVMPRLKRFGEAVDDHQLALGRRLDELGLVVLVEDPSALRAAVDASEVGRAFETADSALARHVRSYLLANRRT
jgi:UDP-N-acetylglucosamine transferase subunit ALG13